MNVLLVSQCSKRALTETRRILDQFAERRGERTWQTPITQAGLDTLRKLLLKNSFEILFSSFSIISPKVTKFP